MTQQTKACNPDKWSEFKPHSGKANISSMSPSDDHTHAIAYVLCTHSAWIIQTKPNQTKQIQSNKLRKLCLILEFCIDFNFLLWVKSLKNPSHSRDIHFFFPLPFVTILCDFPDSHLWISFCGSNHPYEAMGCHNLVSWNSAHFISECSYLQFPDLKTKETAAAD